MSIRASSDILLPKKSPNKGARLLDRSIGMPLDLDEGLRFGFLIHDVSRLRKIVVDRALKPLEITRSQWWVLAFLSRRDGMTQTALARDLDLTKVAIGRLMDRLEASEFIIRKSDAEDGRSRRVYLTKKGNRLIKAIRENVKRVERDILKNVEAGEMETAAKVLLSLKSTLLELLEAEN